MYKVIIVLLTCTELIIAQPSVAGEDHVDLYTSKLP